MKNDWLEILKKVVIQDDNFFVEMNKQLSKQFEEVVPVSIDKFKLIPPVNKLFAIHKQRELFYLKADLLHADVVFSIQLVWKQIDGNLKFWWLKLPHEEIIAELNI